MKIFRLKNLISRFEVSFLLSFEKILDKLLLMGNKEILKNFEMEELRFFLLNEELGSLMVEIMRWFMSDWMQKIWPLRAI